MSHFQQPGSGDRASLLPGASFGHWTHSSGHTGCTAIIFHKQAPAAVHVAGGAPGTQETDLLRPGMLVAGVDAIMLSGGSAFGLDAAGGARKYLAEKGRGFAAGGFAVPIVPSAVIFDLPSSGGLAPGVAEGYLACQNSETGQMTQGRVGAGAGATVGKYLGRAKAAPGGLACRSIQENSVTVAALVVANCFGAVWDMASGSMVAGPKDSAGAPLEYLHSPPAPPAFGNTALGVVVTNAALDCATALRVAMMAHDGWARCVRPSHTPYDGDVIFVVSTGAEKMDLARLGAMAAAAIEQTTIAAVSNR